MEAAEKFRRDDLPAMQRGAARLTPYVRRIYDQAVREVLPGLHDPHRRPPFGSLPDE